MNRTDLFSAKQGQQLLDYFWQRRDEMIHLLSQLVEIESPSTDRDAQQPILDRLTQALRARDFRVQRIRGDRSGGHLFARPQALSTRCPKQLLLGHCDTVWPLDTLKTMPLIRQAEQIQGPGTYDMKAGLVMAIYALDALQQLDLSPALLPLLLINSDEEIGSFESSRYIHHCAQQVQRAYVLEPSLGTTGKLKTARKGVGRFSITVKGKAAHAGLEPGKGASAILELSHVIQSLFALNDPERGITVNVGTIDGGIRSNVVAPESRAEVDVRVLHEADARWIESKILNLSASTPGTQLEVEGKIGRPPMEKTERNQELWQAAQQVAFSLGIELEDAIAGGGSDGNTTSLYTATLDGLGAVGGGAHAPDEFIWIDPWIERTALLTQLLLLPELPSRSTPLDTQTHGGRDHDPLFFEHTHANL